MPPFLKKNACEQRGTCDKKVVTSLKLSKNGFVGYVKVRSFAVPLIDQKNEPK